jgi:hypothetical protein
MNKQLLLGGSILAVVVLVLAGLSPVVGYNSVESSGVKDSPLFHLRAQRAINKEENVQTCTYLGKGRATDILFPTRDSYQTELLKQILDRMRMVDDESIGELLDEIEKKMKEDNFNYKGNLGDPPSAYFTCACTIKYGDPILSCLFWWLVTLLEIVCFFPPEWFTT